MLVMPRFQLALLCLFLTAGCDEGSSAGNSAGAGGASASGGGSTATGGVATASGGSTSATGGSATGTGGSTGGSATATGGSATGGSATGGSATGGSDDGLVWSQANLTNYTSYPDPNSEECIEYNGCMWAGYFAALPDQQTPEWVQANNIIAVHEKDFSAYQLKTLRLRQGDKHIDAVVYDMCADSDCEGCCTQNASQNGLNFLIDIESFSMERFGSGDGIVEWACLDCDAP
jgi:hypothetical protein